MGNAGSMDSQQTDFRAHNVPLKLPMPEPGELEERFAIVLWADKILRKKPVLIWKQEGTYNFMEMNPGRHKSVLMY
ncbi:hypothetical protein STEG23_025112 [Scotinomys teguina]